MKTRSITAIFIAIVYVGTVLLSIYLNEVFFDIFVLMIAVGAGLEMCRALEKKFSPPVDLFVVLYAFLGYVAYFLVERFFDVTIGLAVYLLVFVLFAAVCFLYCGLSKRKVLSNATSTVLAMIYPITVLTYMLAINSLPAPYRIDGILLLFIVSVLTDTMAYFVGSLLHGPKLCPKISPKKTVSGAIGGLLGGVGGAMIVFAFAKTGVLKADLLVSKTGMNVLHFAMLGLFGSLFNQAGDLVASYIKRKCDVKDYGTLLPGHGGVMDRIDGMMLNAVLIFCYLSFFLI